MAEMYAENGTLARVGLATYASVVRDLGDPLLTVPIERFYAGCGVADEWCAAAWQYPEPIYPPPVGIEEWPPVVATHPWFGPLRELPPGTPWEPPELTARRPPVRSRGLVVRP